MTIKHGMVVDLIQNGKVWKMYALSDLVFTDLESGQDHFLFIETGDTNLAGVTNDDSISPKEIWSNEEYKVKGFPLQKPPYKDGHYSLVVDGETLLCETQTVQALDHSVQILQSEQDERWLENNDPRINRITLVKLKE